MGITIHYKGSLNEGLERAKIIEIITDIARAADWSIEEINDQEKDLRGVILGVHEKCEPFPFLFDSYNQMRSVFWLIGVAEPDERWIFTKTQYGGIEPHIVTIKFLEFMKNNYIADLEVEDETEYWKHRDPQILKQKFAQMNFILDSFAKMLESADLNGDTNIETIVKKIEEVSMKLFEKFKSDKNRIV